MKTIGEKIAELRREKAITQESLASVIGVSSQAISKWENNVTMPDITLLPLIAELLGVTIDELFGLEHHPPKKTVPYEEIPMAVYDEILKTMWQTENSFDLEKHKEALNGNSGRHTGFISEIAGAVYADRDLALTYLPDRNASLKLLEDEAAAAYLNTLSEKNVRVMIGYLCQNRAKTFTAASSSASTGLSDEEVSDALEKLHQYNMVSAMDVDIGSAEMLRAYRIFAEHKMPLLIFPLLTLAVRLSDFKECWYGFRG